jgi:hypothetical protein
MEFKKFFNMHYNKGPDLGASMATVEEALKYWNFEKPKEMVRMLMHTVGPPAEVSIIHAKWNYLGGFDKVCVVDEEVPHGDHIDFVYCCKKIGVEPALYTPFAEVSGSILIDGTMGVVKARCGSLLANAITLGFVQDVVAGNVEPTVEEYERRMEENDVPDWFQDKLGEMNESLNEQFKPKNIKEIQKKADQLKKKLNGKPVRENFGQKELRQLEDFTGWVGAYDSPDRQKITKIIDDFSNWVMNYTG